MEIQIYALPVFLLLIGIESRLYAKRKLGPYPWKQSASSLAMALGYYASKLLTASLIIPAYHWVYGHRIATLEMHSAFQFVLLFFGIEFFYYWQHRFSHEIRWIWASHAVHHAPNTLSLSTAYQLAWTSLISGIWIFFLPLVYFGFAPKVVFVATSINLLYQFWLHTDLIPKLGWFEKWFNTPSHHRVHHGSNPIYLDKNYGGVVIFYDRWFGTFQEELESEPVKYGLVHPLKTLNPIKVAFHEWIHLFQRVRSSHGLRAKWIAAFGRPNSPHPAEPHLPKKAELISA